MMNDVRRPKTLKELLTLVGQASAGDIENDPWLAGARHAARLAGAEVDRVLGAMENCFNPNMDLPEDYFADTVLMDLRDFSKRRKKHG